MAPRAQAAVAKDDDARNDGRKQFPRPVDEGRHRDLTGAGEDHHAADGRQAERSGHRNARREIDGRDDGRTEIARTDRSQPNTLENGHEGNCDHGEADGALRGVMRQFRGFRDQRHHYEIGANDGDMLESEREEMRPGRFLV